MLPLVIVMSAISALLWYWRILPFIIKGISYIFERALGTRGPAGLVATANIFMGQIEAPLLVRPYLARMTRYELLLVMTAGMATIAGSVMVIYSAMLGEQMQGVLGQLITKSIMSVPAAILFAHVMIPEDNDSSQELEKPPRIYESSMDAVTRGTSDGLNIYLNILAILIVAIALVALVNGIIGFLEVGGAPLTMERLAGWVFAPIAWLMGVPWTEARPWVAARHQDRAQRVHRLPAAAGLCRRNIVRAQQAHRAYAVADSPTCRAWESRSPASAPCVPSAAMIS